MTDENENLTEAREQAVRTVLRIVDLPDRPWRLLVQLAAHISPSVCWKWLVRAPAATAAGWANTTEKRAAEGLRHLLRLGYLVTRDEDTYEIDPDPSITRLAYTLSQTMVYSRRRPADEPREPSAPPSARAEGPGSGDADNADT